MTTLSPPGVSKEKAEEIGPGVGWESLAGARHLPNLGTQLLCSTEAASFQPGCWANWVSVATHTGLSMCGTEGDVKGEQGGDRGNGTICSSCGWRAGLWGRDQGVWDRQ